MRSRWVRIDHGKSRSANESLRTIKSKQSLGQDSICFLFLPALFSCQFLKGASIYDVRTEGGWSRNTQYLWANS